MFYKWVNLAFSKTWVTNNQNVWIPSDWNAILWSEKRGRQELGSECKTSQTSMCDQLSKPTTLQKQSFFPLRALWLGFLPSANKVRTTSLTAGSSSFCCEPPGSHVVPWVSCHYSGAIWISVCQVHFQQVYPASVIISCTSSFKIVAHL